MAWGSAVVCPAAAATPVHFLCATCLCGVYWGAGPLRQLLWDPALDRPQAQLLLTLYLQPPRFSPVLQRGCSLEGSTDGALSSGRPAGGASDVEVVGGCGATQGL